MSQPSYFDKEDASIITAMMIIIGYIGYVLLYPSAIVPEELSRIIFMAVTFLFGVAPTVAAYRASRIS
jgi:NADH:ubiquinone oxidoreductase subunit 3 (subunit A)